MNNLTKDKESRTFNNRFYIKKRISAGSFGVVFICTDSQTSEFVALKVEKDEGDDMMSLERETQILSALQGLIGIPKLLWHGFEHGFNCMALSLLGRDLSYHMRNLRKFSLKCVCNIADQLLNLLEGIHKRNVIHRDIKPENILTGRDPEQNVLYFVDFGISKFYRQEDGQHIPPKEGKPFMGTTRYASIGAHKGQELSRRDDLESVGYVLVYLLKGILPWQNIQSNSDKEKTKLVGQMKMSLETEELCKDTPIEFVRYFDYCKKLTFKQVPDYKYLQQLFHKVGSQHGFVIDRKFDWTEQGTTTTKSGDTNRKNSKVVNRAPSSASRDHKGSIARKPQTNELSSSSLFSQGDFLKLPRKKARNENRHRSMGDGESEKDSHQSSVHLNYVPSLFQKSSQLIHTNIKIKPTFQHLINRSQHHSASVAFQSMGSAISSEKKMTIQDNSVFNQQENFQDLEALEEIMNKDKEAESPIKKVSKTNIVVKGGILKEPLKIQETTYTVCFDDFIDDDEGLSSKVSKLSFPTKHFKQTLSKK